MPKCFSFRIKNVRPQPVIDPFSGDNEITIESSSITSRLAIQTSSYKALWCLISENPAPQVGDVLYQTSEDVGALLEAREDDFSGLAVSYFKNTEEATQLFLRILRCIGDTRAIYAPLGRVLSVLPLGDGGNSSVVTLAECHEAYDAFSDFDSFHSPFISESFGEIRNDFSLLHDKFKDRLVACRSWSRRPSQPSSTHRRTFSARFAVALVGQLSRRSVRTDEVTPGPRLDAAVKGFLAVRIKLDDVLRLVDVVCLSLEFDKVLVQTALVTGRDRHPMIEIMERLWKNWGKVEMQLIELEEDICLSLKYVNTTRQRLFEEIQQHF